MPSRILASVAVSLLMVGAFGCGGNGSNEASQREQAAQARYRTYLQKNAQKLTHWADTLTLKIAGGENSKAGSRYAAARVPYGHLAPAAENFARLNRRISGLEPEVPPGEFGGFHELEKAIFWEKTSSEMKAVARRLRLDVEELGSRLDSAELSSGEIVAGAIAVLRGVQANEVWGEGEPWAHCDFTDIAAKIEGVDAAYQAVLPQLEEQDPDLAKQIEAQLRKAYTEVGENGIFAREPEQARAREPGISFVVYDQVTQEERWELGELVTALTDLMARAGDEFGGS
jgi:iron uptake system component EfeO